MPIIAVILMLLAPDAKAASVAFLVGWVAGITILVTVVALVVNPTSDSSADKPSTLASVLMIVLGAAAVLDAPAAAGDRRRNPRQGPGGTMRRC